MNDRVKVDLTVACTLPDETANREARGKINDLSISGMKIDLPFPPARLRSKLLDFVLDLPKPFSTIRGHGEIKWKRWNAGKGCTTCGLKLSPLSLKQLEEVDAIVSELQEDLRKAHAAKD